MVEPRTGHKLHLLYNTTLTLTLSANARSNWPQKMVILEVRLCANLKTGTLSCERRDVFSSKKIIPGSTLFNTLVSVHRWLPLLDRKCLSHLPLLHSCSSVDHTHIVPIDVMRSIPFKDMLSGCDRDITPRLGMCDISITTLSAHALIGHCLGNSHVTCQKICFASTGLNA